MISLFQTGHLLINKIIIVFIFKKLEDFCNVGMVKLFLYPNAFEELFRCELLLDYSLFDLSYKSRCAFLMQLDT